MTDLFKHCPTINKPFWQEITLAEMNPVQWESLCDRCGLCCLHKLEDMNNKELYYTNVACKCLDTITCQCTNYSSRNTVAGCIHLSPDKVEKLSWLPKTCAYRLVSEGKDLKWWHPLVCGSHEKIHQAGISVRGRCISERVIDMRYLENFIIDWSI